MLATTIGSSSGGLPVGSLIAASEVSTTTGDLLIGLLFGIVIYIAGEAVAHSTRQPLFKLIGALVAVFVFLVLAFDIY